MLSDNERPSFAHRRRGWWGGNPGASEITESRVMGGDHMHKLCATGRSSVFFSFALSAVDGARAQNVVNPSFEIPVAGPPQNYISDPPATGGVGWTFSAQPLG